MKYSRVPLKDQKKYKEKYGTTFQAGHYKWKIVYCTNIFNGEQECAGLCKHDTKSIYIDIKLPNVEETLIHEMFHAECFEVGLYTMQSWHSDLEELAAEACSRTVRNFELRKKNVRRKRNTG
jgi:hypothetical protein